MASIRFNIGGGFVFEYRLATAVVRGDIVHHATTQVVGADGNGNVSITVLDDALYFGRAVKSGATTELTPFYTKPGANFETMTALAKEMMEGDEGLTAAREAWLAVVDQVNSTAAQAKASATAAANSATAAANSANNAAASATAANNSKNAAATSATNAANSANTANSTVTQGVKQLTATRDDAANTINVAKDAATAAIVQAQRNAITTFNNQVASSSVSTIGTSSQAGKILKADGSGLVYSTHTPTSNNELANKLYVDNSISGVRGGVVTEGDTLQKVYSRLLTALDEIEGIKSDIISTRGTWATWGEEQKVKITYRTAQKIAYFRTYQQTPQQVLDYLKENPLPDYLLPAQYACLPVWQWDTSMTGFLYLRYTHQHEFKINGGNTSAPVAVATPYLLA